MSIIIKSNSIYSGNIPAATMDQVITTKGAVYDSFVSRVQSDGGVVVSTQKISDAIDFLFDNNLYGRMGVCASPHYAKKLDAEGGVLKLYSIDGVDLVGMSVGGGILPKITADNFVDFNEGVNYDTVGGILTTATKKSWSKTGRIAYAVATKGSVNTNNSYSFGLTTHGETAIGSPPMSLLTNGTVYMTRIHASVYGGEQKELGFQNTIRSGATLGSYDKVRGILNSFVDGLETAKIKLSTVPSGVWENEHYLDFGGAILKNIKIVSGIKMSAMWFLSDFTQTQQEVISRFIAQQYL